MSEKAPKSEKAKKSEKVAPEKPAPEKLPPLKPPPLEEVLVAFADQVKEHFTALEAWIKVLADNVASLILRVNTLETTPHGDVAATVEALGKILAPVLQRLGMPGSPGPVLPDLGNIATTLKQATRLPPPTGFRLPATAQPPQPNAREESKTAPAPDDSGSKTA